MNLYPLPNALLFFCFIITSKVTVSNPTHFTGDVSINCGSIGTYAARNGREWIGDVQPKSSSLLQMKGSSTTSTHKSISSADLVPHKTARISQSQFSYAFQVSPGQKILRLHFSPSSSSYKGFKVLKDLFTVEIGPFTLLSNFSASLTAAALGVHSFAKEFCLSIQENQQLDIIFSPESSQTLDTYAFINGIEIVSVPAGVSYFQSGDTGFQLLGEKSRVHFNHNTALEISHRVEIKQSSAPSTRVSDDVFPNWATGNAKERKNNKWKIQVDVGFKYLVRVHFSELALKIAEIGDGIFEVLINEMTAQTNIDLVKERDESNITWYRDYMVIVRGNKKEGKRDLLIALQLYDDHIDGHALLSGFEILKLSNSDNSLASPNPLPSHTIQTSSSVLFHRNAISFFVITIISLVNIIVYKLRETWEADIIAEDNHKPQPSARAERLCRRFSLAEIQLATNNFSNGVLIGRGGFGKVYKGHIDKEQKAVAIKRLKSNSKQGAREFLTEIETLSELRHVNLVSLIGYCNEHREMILVYEYMPCGTLSDHLYKLERESESSSSLPWKQRLDICIGAGRGLDYLHTGHGVIHRDVKASNILLDENFIAKVSDFGLAKHGYRSKLRSHISTNVKGTYGYLDPNYLHTRKLTSKSDTYAFGVVLLEVLCGRPAEDLMLAADERVLARWAQDKIDKGEVDQIVAASLRDKILPNSLKTFVGVAQRCLLYEPKKRPTMSQVVLELELAVQQQERKQPLEIASAYDYYNHHTNDKVELSVTTGQPKMSSTALQNLTPSTLKEQRNKKVVIAQLPSAKKHGITAARRKPSPLWSWDKFWNRSKPLKGYELLLSEIREGNIKLAEFDSETIAAATDQFSFSNVIAYDGFGRTYKAVLPTGNVVAVKCLSPNARQGNREFLNEIRILSNLQHRNVIKLLGYCVHRDEKSVVYEFTGNTCLQDNFVPGHLHLQWPERFKIIMGIARGLIYLHQELAVIVIHRDLNTGNVLLDNEMNPKISNFAFARTLVDDQSELETKIIAGTSMLTPPEYATEGKYSIKSDVYSFGIIILEMVIGTRTVYRHASGAMNVVGYAWKLWNEDNPLDVVDKSLGGAFSADEVLRCIQVGLLCTEEQPHLRPGMPSVVYMLEGNELIVKPLKPWNLGPIGYSACSSVDADDGLDSIATMEFDDTLER